MWASLSCQKQETSTQATRFLSITEALPLCDMNKGEPQQCGVPTMTKNPLLHIFFFLIPHYQYFLCCVSLTQHKKEISTKERRWRCVFNEHMFI